MDISEPNFLEVPETEPPAAQLAEESARALALDFGVWGIRILQISKLWTLLAKFYRIQNVKISLKSLEFE